MGCGGARLTHGHERQYQYVLQTLTLWREISNDMFKLWYPIPSHPILDSHPVGIWQRVIYWDSVIAIDYRIPVRD